MTARDGEDDALVQKAKPKLSPKTKAEQELAMVEQEFKKEYSQKVIYFCFVLIFFSNILINIDHGALPGCSLQIKKKLDIDNFKYGLLGSVVFGGLTLGSATGTVLFSKGSWIKPTLIITIFINATCCFLFTQSSNFYIMAFMRGLIGYFQIFICIYMPVWADQFGNEQQKSIWLTFLLLAAPVGNVIGFTLTYYMT